MIYLDHGATSFPKPKPVTEAVKRAMECCGNPGRGGHPAAARAQEVIYDCREQAAALFSCGIEQVVLTSGCTQGLNMAISSLFKPGDRVVVSGFEHNAVVRTLWGHGIEALAAGRKLFDWQDTLADFEKQLDQGAAGAVFTHVSNVFGYILPIAPMAALCRKKNLPFILDAAQSAGMMEVNFEALGADFIAMPGHKGLLGPMGTGLLLCGRPGNPFLFGGTGTASRELAMPEFLPERLEAGTPNVPGIAGLAEGIRLVRKLTPEKVGEKEAALGKITAEGLRKLGLKVFAGPHQGGTVSFVPRGDCQELADRLGEAGIALRAGLHCAPLAHSSAGTLETGTVRISFGWDSDFSMPQAVFQALSKGRAGIF